MSNLFSLNPSSSFPSLSPLTPPKKFSFWKAKPTFQLKKPALVTSVLSTKTDPQIPQSVQTFWQWLCDEGVVSSKTPVKPGVVPEGLGLVATRDIAKNEVVLEVPKRFWINPDAAAASEIGSVCSGLKPWIAVALFLLTEKSREDSKWKFYFEILPQSTDSTIFWLVQLNLLYLFSVLLENFCFWKFARLSLFDPYCLTCSSSAGQTRSLLSFKVIQFVFLISLFYIGVTGVQCTLHQLTRGATTEPIGIVAYNFSCRTKILVKFFGYFYLFPELLSLIY